MDKTFLIYWGKGYSDPGKRKRVSESFFTYPRGYKPIEIFRINSLQIGQRIKLSELFKTCTVKRIR